VRHPPSLPPAHNANAKADSILLAILLARQPEARSKTHTVIHSLLSFVSKKVGVRTWQKLLITDDVRVIL
jgi:hypothetical protein